MIRKQIFTIDFTSKLNLNKIKKMRKEIQSLKKWTKNLKQDKRKLLHLKLLK